MPNNTIHRSTNIRILLYNNIYYLSNTCYSYYTTTKLDKLSITLTLFAQTSQMSHLAISFFSRLFLRDSTHIHFVNHSNDSIFNKKKSSSSIQEEIELMPIVSSTFETEYIPYTAHSVFVPEIFVAQTYKSTPINIDTIESDCINITPPNVTIQTPIVTIEPDCYNITPHILNTHIQTQIATIEPDCDIISTPFPVSKSYYNIITDEFRIVSCPFPPLCVPISSLCTYFHPFLYIPNFNIHFNSRITCWHRPIT